MSKKLKEAVDSYNDLRDALENELNEMRMTWGGGGSDEWSCWVRDFSDAWVVFSMNGVLNQADYTIDATGEVSFGEPFEVVPKTTYVPTSDADSPATTESSKVVRLKPELIDLVEGATENGLKPIKIIEPGWGSSGYYAPEMLKRDGESVFTKGTQMFWDHPTESEGIERPERSLYDLAATLAEDAAYLDDGPDGAGLYAKAQVFEPFVERFDDPEFTSSIGVSIRASGEPTFGEAEGRRGTIVEKITDVASIDFVTKPGAGGKVLQLFESTRREARKMAEANNETPAWATALEAKVDDLASKIEGAPPAPAPAPEAPVAESESRRTEALLVREAKLALTEKLAEAELPDVTKKRLVESIAANPPAADDGTLDAKKLDEIADEKIAEEAEYLSEATSAGKVTGMGGSSGADESTLDEQIEASLKGAFNLSESGAKIAAGIGRR